MCALTFLAKHKLYNVRLMPLCAEKLCHTVPMVGPKITVATDDCGEIGIVTE